MSGRIEANQVTYTLDELAQTLGVTESEATIMLEERGYHFSSDQPLLKFTEEEYRDLMEEPPLEADPY
jgi:hypothetical protein